MRTTNLRIEIAGQPIEKITESEEELQATAAGVLPIPTQRR
jgi:hypothetical protein